MDITTIPIVSATTQSYKAPVIPATPVPTQAQQQQAASDNDFSNSQSEYEAAAKAAAASSFNYPLGSKEFTIYKDVTGALITRYVSLIDGSVTYLPAPVYIKPQSVAIDV